MNILLRNLTNLQSNVFGLTNSEKNLLIPASQKRHKIKMARIRKGDVNLAKERLGSLAFFGLTEKFQGSLFLFCYTFGLRPLKNTLHLNATPSDHSNPNPTLNTLVSKYIASDIELYRFAEQVFDWRYERMIKELLTSYGTEKESILPQPLPSDVVFQLLEKHYIRRRDQRRNYFLPATDVFYTPSMYTEGPFGWYPLETSDAHGAFRWSGPGVESGFDLLSPLGREINLTFCLLGAPKMDIIQKLKLTINNVAINIRFDTDNEGRFIFSGKISLEAESPFLRFVFFVPETVAPNSLDTRLLGIALNWIKMSAVN